VFASVEVYCLSAVNYLYRYPSIRYYYDTTVYRDTVCTSEYIHIYSTSTTGTSSPDPSWTAVCTLNAFTSYRYGTVRYSTVLSVVFHTRGRYYQYSFSTVRESLIYTGSLYTLPVHSRILWQVLGMVQSTSNGLKWLPSCDSSCVSRHHRVWLPLWTFHCLAHNAL
jgi:hypothetical protein